MVSSSHVVSLDFSNRFHINDVVKLVNCTVQDKPESDQERMYNPSTSVSFRINVSRANRNTDLHAPLS